MPPTINRASPTAAAIPSTRTTNPAASPRAPATSSAPTKRHSCAPRRNWSRICNDCLAPMSLRPPAPRNATARSALRTMVAIYMLNLSSRVEELALAPLENDVATGLWMRQPRPIDVVRERVQFDWSGRSGGSFGHLRPRVQVLFPEDEEDRLGVLPQRPVQLFG